MSIVLPIAVFLMLWRIFACQAGGVRDALLRAATISITLVGVLTELLSVPRLLTKPILIAAWLLCLLCTAPLLYRFGRDRTPLPHPSIPALPATWVDSLLLAAIGINLAVIGLIALVAPPNTWDAMEYHLPRIMFWVSNHTLRNYPTPDYAQLIQGSAAEFVTLHSYLLWGSDRLANLPEFFSLVGSAVAASLIAKELGAGKTGQLIAALFLVTIPEAVLESSGSMTTGVVSFWIITACYFLLRAGETQREWHLVLAALATGLALLTKGIAFIYLPFILLACVALRPAASRLWLLKRAPLFVVLALVLSTGQFIRNYQVTGTPLGAPFPAGGPRLNFRTERVTPATTAASVVRHVTLHTETPVNKINARIERFAHAVIRLLGQDPDDQRQIWIGYPFSIDHPTRLETQAGNPVHFVVVVFCFVGIFVLGSRRIDRKLLWYTGGIALAFVIFCGLIRWQPWGSRFHLPLFVLASVTVGAIIEQILSRRLQAVFAGFLFVMTLPYLLSNSPRSILHTKGFATIFEPRSTLYMADHHLNEVQEYASMIRAVRATKCERVALRAYLPIPEDHLINSPPAFFVYPLLAQISVDGKTRIVHYIGVANPTSRFAAAASPASECVIVCLSCALSHGQVSYAQYGETRLFGLNEVTAVTHASQPSAVR